MADFLTYKKVELQYTTPMGVFSFWLSATTTFTGDSDSTTNIMGPFNLNVGISYCSGGCTTDPLLVTVGTGLT